MTYRVEFTVEEEDDLTYTLVCIGEDKEILAKVPGFASVEAVKRAVEDAEIMYRKMRQ